MTDTVGIVGTFRNGAKYLSGYLDSLVRLDYPKMKMRVFLIDGESTDGTKERLEQFVDIHRSKYLGLQLISRPRPSEIAQESIVDALNLGIALSEPHDLIIMEQDIVVLPHTIKRLLEIRDGGADIASGLTVVTGREMYLATDTGGLWIGGMPYLSASQVGENPNIPDRTLNYYAGMYVMYLPEYACERVIAVDFVGSALLFVKRTVLETLKFRYLKDRTQDVTFCLDARKLGYTVAVDTGLWYDHKHYEYDVKRVKGLGMYVRLTGGRNDKIKVHLFTDEQIAKLPERERQLWARVKGNEAV